MCEHEQLALPPALSAASACASSSMVSASVWRPRHRSKKVMAWVRWLKRERLPLCTWPTRLSRKPLWDQGPMTSSLPACRWTDAQDFLHIQNQGLLTSSLPACYDDFSKRLCLSANKGF